MDEVFSKMQTESETRKTELAEELKLAREAGKIEEDRKKRFEDA